MGFYMRNEVKNLIGSHYDLTIIGGGIFAACAAWDAVLRGLTVALIEKEDFCSGVSANSLKMIHGGIRYLQHGDIIRLKSSCHERSAMLRIAPHLVEPLPILIPTYGHGKSGKLFLGTGMLLYDLLTLGRNRGIRDPERHIPLTAFLSKEEALQEYPDLEQKGLTGAAVFSDGQMFNPTRLVLAFIKTAMQKGAHVANYVEAVNLLHEDKTVTGVAAVDKESGQKIKIRSRAVLNAAGPWSEWFLSDSIPHGKMEKVVYSRDACFVVKRRFKSHHALAIMGRTKDPDALLSRPARHIFMAPWRDYTLVGVWHVVWDKHPDEVTVDESEIQAFIDEINWAYPGLNLTIDDIKMWNAGLVPFGDNEEGQVNLSYGKRSHLIDHKRIDQIDGLVTLIGVRYTTGRSDAAKAIDLICKKLNMKARRPATNYIPITGGDIGNFESLVRQAHHQQTLGLSLEVVRELAHNYGTEVYDVLGLASKDQDLARPINGTKVLRAEVQYAVDAEMARHLADVVFRRTGMATGGNPGVGALQECAELMADLLGWDDQDTRIQINNVLRRFPAWNHMTSAK